MYFFALAVGYRLKIQKVVWMCTRSDFLNSTWRYQKPVHLKTGFWDKYRDLGQIIGIWDKSHENGTNYRKMGQIKASFVPNPGNLSHFAIVCPFFCY